MYAQNVHIKEKGAIAERKNNKCKKKGMIYIMDKIAGVIAQELGVKEFQVQNTIKLIDDGIQFLLLLVIERKQQED